MKRKLTITSLSLMALFLAVPRSASASRTWYVNGASGSDGNNCASPLTACKTIAHAITLAASGDSIRVAAATYAEHLTIGFSLNVIGFGANTTIIDGVSAGRVISIPNTSSTVTLSNVTIRNGLVGGAVARGGGIYNAGTLTINNCNIATNHVKASGGSWGAGIYNAGSLIVNNSTVSENKAGPISGGGGIYSTGALTINNSTIAGNSANLGGGIVGGATINKSTVSANTAYVGGAIHSGALVLINSTLSGNAASKQGGGVNNIGTLNVFSSTFSGNRAANGGGIFNNGGTTRMQDSIIANSPSGGNCSGVITSNGYNMSSDGTCNFHNSGDRNTTDPMLGPLQNNGGPTQTMALPSGSPAIDAGNPSGCTDNSGHMLTTDQRGFPRPDKEDTGGCDMGAYERQTD